MKRNILTLLLLAVGISLSAQLQLPNILSDNMVLQQQSTVRLWGNAKRGTQVDIKAGWLKDNISARTDESGYWEKELETSQAGGPYTISISSAGESKILKNILLGEVWICAGQSNMSMPVRGFVSQPIDGSLDAIVDSEKHNDIRMFTADRTIAATPQTNVKGTWQCASINTTASFSAIGYFYACELQRVLRVPVGMINLSWGGSNAQAWMSSDLLKTFPQIDLSKIDMKSKSPQRIPTALYNGMLYPVAKYNVKGIIWYQGENNISDYQLYANLFPAMVGEWRTTIGRGDIPFYYVQIAPYKYDGETKTSSAFLREVQLRSQYLIPNSGMVTTGDLGNSQLIHAPQKKEISQRLAYMALAKTYTYTKLPHAAPILRKKEVSGNRLILTFDHADSGMVLKDNASQNFFLAGKDGIYHPAKATVSGNDTGTVEVWSEQVATPENVRYCFRNYFESTLYNNYMIPASPFRTDTLDK